MKNGKFKYRVKLSSQEKDKFVWVIWSAPCNLPKSQVYTFYCSSNLEAIYRSQNVPDYNISWDMFALLLTRAMPGSSVVTDIYPIKLITATAPTLTPCHQHIMEANVVFCVSGEEQVDRETAWGW